MSTPNPKLVVTKPMLRQLVWLADERRVRRGRKNPNKATTSLTQCRDQFWKGYGHTYRRYGKAIAEVLNPSMARRGKYDDFANFMDGLSESDLKRAIDEIKKKYFPPVVPVQVTPTPPPTPPTPSDKFGQDVHQFEDGSGPRSTVKGTT